MSSESAAHEPQSTPRRRARPDDSKRAERRHAEIIKAGLTLFSEKGYASTSTKDIGDLVGLLPGSLYYHIRSKEDLLYQILLELHEIALRDLNEIEAMGGTPIQRLRQLVKSHVTRYDLPAVRLFEAEFHHLNEVDHQKILRMRRKYQRQVINLIKQAQREGLCDPQVDARTMGVVILAMVNSLPKWFDMRRPSRVDGVAEAVDRLLLGGLGVDRAALDEAES